MRTFYLTTKLKELQIFCIIYKIFDGTKLYSADERSNGRECYSWTLLANTLHSGHTQGKYFFDKINRPITSSEQNWLIWPTMQDVSSQGVKLV